MKLRVFLAILLLLIIALPASAAVFQSGDEYSLPAGEVVTEDLYVTGGSITTAGEVRGDVLAAGGKVLINGIVSGDVTAVGGSVDVLSEVGDDVRAAGGQVVVGGNLSGDLLVAGGQVHVLSDVSVGNDAVVAGGRVVIDGDVAGDLRVYGDEVRVNGVVVGNLDVFADNSFALGPDARVGGNLTYRTPLELTLEEGVVAGTATHEPHNVRFDQSLLNAVMGAAFMLKLLMLLVAGLLVATLFNSFSYEMSTYAVPHFGKSLLMGFVLLIVVPAIAFLLFASVIGIIVASVLLLAYVLLLVVAKIYAGILAGALLARWIRKETIVDWRWAFIGIVVLQLVSLVPVIGWALSAVIMLTAFGALAHFIHERFWVAR